LLEMTNSVFVIPNEEMDLAKLNGHLTVIHVHWRWMIRQPVDTVAAILRREARDDYFTG